ncbi:MAG: hypothetical protein H6739_32335 [Alphaproteobacteria bacterium]|nr:hypothetical protein [Alphaproteobacteria bacterium]
MGAPEQYTVYIQGNARMTIPARVAGYSFARWSREDVTITPHIMWAEEVDALTRREGDSYLRGGVKIEWRNGDLCSFMPTRMLAPTLAGFKGRALVTDPDMFAIKDPLPLLRMDMQGKAMWAAPPPPYRDGPYETSLMLMDCAKMTHWKFEERIEKMFRGELDYSEWERLRLEDPDTVGTLGYEWNSMDILDENTRILHNTNYMWWPWKSGRPVEYWEHQHWVRKGLSPYNAMRLVVKALRRRGRTLAGRVSSRFERQDIYPHHPDPRQEESFIKLLREAVDAGALERWEIEREIELGHVRADLLHCIDQGMAAAK